MGVPFQDFCLAVNGIDIYNSDCQKSTAGYRVSVVNIAFALAIGDF
jgi:hypothetical protein